MGLFNKIEKEHNMTIFLTTHYMDEAEICDNIAIIDSGKIVAHGTPIQLKEELAENIIKFKSSDAKHTLSYLEKIILMI